MKTNQVYRQSGAVMWPVLTLIVGVAALVAGIWVAMVLQPVKQQQPQLNKEAVTAALKNVGDVSFASPSEKGLNETFPSVSATKVSDDQKQTDDYDVAIHHLSRSISSDQYAREKAESILSRTSRNFSPTALKVETDKLIDTFRRFGRTVEARQVADIDKTVHSLGTIKTKIKDGTSIEFSCYGLAYALVRDGQEGDAVFLENLQSQVIVCAHAESGYVLEQRLARSTIVGDISDGTPADRTSQNSTPKANSSDFGTTLSALRDNLITKLPVSFVEKELKV